MIDVYFTYKIKHARTHTQPPLQPPWSPGVLRVPAYRPFCTHPAPRHSTIPELGLLSTTAHLRTQSNFPRRHLCRLQTGAPGSRPRRPVPPSPLLKPPARAPLAPGPAGRPPAPPPPPETPSHGTSESQPVGRPPAPPRRPPPTCRLFPGQFLWGRGAARPPARLSGPVSVTACPPYPPAARSRRRRRQGRARPRHPPQGRRDSRGAASP